MNTPSWELVTSFSFLDNFLSPFCPIACNVIFADLFKRSYFKIILLCFSFLAAVFPQTFLHRTRYSFPFCISK